MTEHPKLGTRRRIKVARDRLGRKAYAQESDDPELRDSGIRVIGPIPWGGHICVFYQTPDDLLDLCTSYFAAGLRDNELCVWAVSDPIDEAEAEAALAAAVPDFSRYRAAGQIEIIPGRDWYLEGDRFNMQRVTGSWQAKIEDARARGFDGLRASGNAFWTRTEHWKEFTEYEHELDIALAGRPAMVLCTYPLNASRAVDILDVVRAHRCSASRRHGAWEFLETPELVQANREIQKLHDALGLLSNPFPGQNLLTPRERITLAQIVRGASNKEAARALGISPRTVEFHRANIMRKLGAKNIADLMRSVLDTDSIHHPG